MKGTGHGIAPDGLGVAVGWMRDRLGIDLNLPPLCHYPVIWAG